MQHYLPPASFVSIILHWFQLIKCLLLLAHEEEEDSPQALTSEHPESCSSSVRVVLSFSSELRCSCVFEDPLTPFVMRPFSGPLFSAVSVPVR